MSNLMAYKMNKLDMARTRERIEHFHKKKWDVSGVLLAYIFRPWHLVMPFDTKSYIKQMLWLKPQENSRWLTQDQIVIWMTNSQMTGHCSMSWMPYVKEYIFFNMWRYTKTWKVNVRLIFWYTKNGLDQIMKTQWHQKPRMPIRHLSMMGRRKSWYCENVCLSLHEVSYNPQEPDSTWISGFEGKKMYHL